MNKFVLPVTVGPSLNLAPGKTSFIILLICVVASSFISSRTWMIRSYSPYSPTKPDRAPEKYELAASDSVLAKTEPTKILTSNNTAKSRVKEFLTRFFMNATLSPHFVHCIIAHLSLLCPYVYTFLYILYILFLLKVAIKEAEEPSPCFLIEKATRCRSIAWFFHD